MIDYPLDADSIDSRIGLSKLLIGLKTGKWRVTVTRWRKRHSEAQRRYLFGVVYPALQAGFKEAWGEDLDKDQIHFAMKDAFLTTAVGPLRVPLGSTRGLTHEQFANFIEDIAKFAAQYLNVPIPEPHEKFQTPLDGVVI